MRRRIRQLWCVGAIALALTGCKTTGAGTTQVTSGEALLAGNQKVVSAPDRLSYDPLKFGETYKYAFDEDASVLQESEKKRFAKGFTLPITNGSYSVNITSYRLGTPDDPAIMYPKIELLDKDYKSVRTLSASAFVLRPSLSGEGLNTVFFVNNGDRGERFMLITNRSVEDADLMTSQANVTSTTPLIVPLGGGLVGMWSIPTGTNTPPVKMKASPTGQIAVLCQEYRPKKVGE